MRGLAMERNRLRSRLAAVIAAALVVVLAGCSDWWKSDSPTDPNLVPFGPPVATWDTGIGLMFVYRTDGPAFSEPAFQDALDDLLFTIERVAGEKAVDSLSLSGQDLVMQDSTKKAFHDSDKGAFFVSGPSEFQRLALEFFCDQSRSSAICGLR